MAEDTTYTKDDLLTLTGEGEETGTHLNIMVSSADLGDDYSVMEGVMAPHQLLAPHSHSYEDQVIIPVNGEMVIEVGGDDGERFTAPAGSYVRKPRGPQHCFWNDTDETVRYIELSGGTGFEGFVDTTTEEGTAVGILKSGPEYGITWYLQRVPKLMEEHNLTSVAGVEMPWDEINVGPPPEVLKKLIENFKTY